MELLVTLEEFESDLPSQYVWKELYDTLEDAEGIAYYRHPLLKAAGQTPPDFTVLAKGWHPFAIRVLGAPMASLERATSDEWVLSGKTIDSPLLQTDDFAEALFARFQQHRPLRNLLRPLALVALPNIDRRAFEDRFPSIAGDRVLFRGERPGPSGRSAPLSQEQWDLARSVFQSAAFPSSKPHAPDMTAPTKGSAIRLLEQDLMILDTEQHKVAVQLPAGPQRIRGLAGTGKTVLLAMKAANLHLRFPERPILFTFFTQSLYNTVTRLITRFFTADSGGLEPNWNTLHIRHAWGGRGRDGVYSDVCARLGSSPMALPEAKARNSVRPLAACAQHALKLSPQSYYDYVLVDEAQDLPAEFFRLLYQISTSPHAIYFAYDELQNLSSVKMPDVAELFGRDGDGRALVSLEGEYPGGIEKDLVLQKSYRCPGNVLMLAHAIGLGLYAPRCVQILPNVAAWQAVGYDVREGDCSAFSSTVVYRPPANSPNRIAKIYRGTHQLISHRAFDSRSDELDWVAKRIIDDIHLEKLLPQDIVVVTIDALSAKNDLGAIQRVLFEAGIQSVIPGIFGSSAAADFGTDGMVTLASVYRAKGNEASAVYVIAADAIGRYSDELDARNKAFTAISRTKGWVCITGAGREMSAVNGEIEKITADIPYFRFNYPDPAKVLQLTAESTRRRAAIHSAKKSVETLLQIDAEALSQMSEETRTALIRRLRGDHDDD